jgi:hypothetical protein
MIIFYSAILGLQSWAIYLLFFGYIKPVRQKPTPVIVECKSKYKPYYLLYDDFRHRTERSPY